MWPRGRRAAGAVFSFPLISALRVASSLSSHRAQLSTSLMPPLRRSRPAFESPPPSSTPSPLPSPAAVLRPAKKRRLKASRQGAVMSTPSSSSSSLTSALLPESDLTANSPLLSSHVSAFLASVASAEPSQRCASLWPLFDKRGGLVGLSLASQRHSLLIDVSPTSDSAPLQSTLQRLFFASPPQPSPHSSRGRVPPSLPAPSWPLLLPFPTSVRLLRRALVRPGDGAASSRSLNPQLRCLTPRIDRLCALTPHLPALPSPPPVLDPSSHVSSSVSLSAEQRLTLSSYHSSLLSRYSRAFAVSDSLGREVERGMRGLSDFRCSYAPLLLSERNHRWAVDGEQRTPPLPLLRLPSSHRVHVVEVGQDATSALQSLRLSAPSPAVLGFDTESRPSTVAGQPMYSPSLVQVSSHSVAVLVRVDPQSGLPPALVALLLDPAYTKVGQGSHADVQQLCAHYHQLPSDLSAEPSAFGFLDLASLSSPLRLDRPGLQGLVGGLMGHRLSKGQQMSNWATSHRLTGSQVEYAALDAFVSLLLKERLEAVQGRLTGLVQRWAEREGVDVESLSSEDLPVLPTPTHKPPPTPQR